MPNHTYWGRAAIQLRIYWRVPNRNVHVDRYRRWFTQRCTHRDNWRPGYGDGDGCKRWDGSDYVHDQTRRVNGYRPMRERHLCDSNDLCDQDARRLCNEDVQQNADGGHQLLE